VRRAPEGEAVRVLEVEREPFGLGGDVCIHTAVVEDGADGDGAWGEGVALENKA
jgi:hypothetical protein